MNNNPTPQQVWAEQYPFGGFSFGPDKPTLHLVQEKGKQVTRFQGSALNGEVRRCLYPDFSFREWTKLVYDDMGAAWLQRLGIDEEDAARREYSPDVIRALVDSSSPGEKDFIDIFFMFSAFESHYNHDDIWEAPHWIPAPIPQVWIQWHSESLPELREWGSPYSSQPQRIDFAMFWNNRRFALLLDGIQHYAVKEGGAWLASEEEYSKRLLEDRFLRINEWNVFRISNWELRGWRKDSSRARKVFGELEEFVGFEFFPQWRKDDWERERYS